MMGHGKHCDCLMCKMGKAVGMAEQCNDQHCKDPSHTKDKEGEKEQKDHNHDKNCDCC